MISPSVAATVNFSDARDPHEARLRRAAADSEAFSDDGNESRKKVAVEEVEPHHFMFLTMT